jgi:opacity protein-like surface antigen
MRRLIVVLIFAIGSFSCLLAEGSSFHFEAGGFYGTWQVVDSDIKNVYGNGMVYFPFLAVTWKGIMLGAGYEGGYSKSGKIGLYQDPTTLKVNGFEVFVGYAFRIKFLAPYFRVGYGSYSYKQTIDSPYLSDFKVDGTKSTYTGSVGIKFIPIKNLFLAIEARYVPLKVKPLEEEVDLSGLRFEGGIGFTI